MRHRNSWFDKFCTVLAKICSQRISFQPRSRLNQCTSSITLHVTPACYSTLRHSITYLHAIRGYPLFHTQKEIDDGAILLKKLYVSRSSNIQWWHAKGQVYFFIAWYGKNGDGFPTNLRFRNPFQICSFLLLQPRHMIYHIWMCMHYEPKTTLSEDWLLASYCSFDTLWNASAKARPLPMSQSIKMPCMRQANIWKQKNCLRMHDSTGPLALHLQFWSNCLLQFASSLLY